MCCQHGIMSRGRWHTLLGIGACALVVVAPALAGITQVRVPAPGEGSHEQIFEGIYGGDFVGSGTDLGYGLWTVFDNGTVRATRVDDFGLGTLLNMLTGLPGSGDDDTWMETGRALATARARFARFPQEFGYDAGSGYVKLLDVPAGGFDVSRYETVQFRSSSTWLWCRCNDSDNGLVNKHCSEESSNVDFLDHMVTYQVRGVPDVPSTSTVWLVFWEDLNGRLGDSSYPDNQGIPADRDFNDLVVEIVVQECLVDADCDQGGGCRIGTCNVDRVCEYRLAAAGAPCGNPSSEGLCDNPDSCDGAGNCLPNYDPASTECRPASGFRRWDLGDFQRFQLCFTGSRGPLGLGCGVFDFDSDSSVDRADWADFVPGWLGPDGSLEFHVSEPAAGVCDRPEFCTGESPYCPPDAFAPATTECRAAAGQCDLIEHCTGVSPYCPPDALAPATTECRPSIGDCDRIEQCTGSTPDCPPDQVIPIGTVCRGPAGACDFQEVCDGASPHCPVDRLKPWGTACPDDGSECTVDVCDGVGIACTHMDNGLCGACCFPDGVCADDMLPETCASQTGTFTSVGTHCEGDADGNGVDDACQTGSPIPTLSQWGMVITILLLLTGGKVFFGRRDNTSTH